MAYNKMNTDALFHHDVSLYDLVFHHFTFGHLIFATFAVIVAMFIVFERNFGSKLSPYGGLVELPPPTEIVDLRIYPIKSCRGISVKQWKVLKTGLDLDRQWMFITQKDRKFVTIRQISKMTLIDTAYNADKDELEISISGTKTKISIPAHPSKQWLQKNTTLKSGNEIWGEETDGYEYAESLTAPISEFLGQDVRLIFKGPTPRILRGNGDPRIIGREEGTKFADFAPVQVSNAQSIAELNQRLEAAGSEAITIERFRPNIVVKGQQPWQEDNWKTATIYDGMSEKISVELEILTRCLRCQVPNVDPDTGVKNKEQPWNVLMKYRAIDKGNKYKPCFGMLCVPKMENEIRVGMKFEVTEVTNDHEFLKEIKDPK